MTTEVRSAMLLVPLRETAVALLIALRADPEEPIENVAARLACQMGLEGIVSKRGDLPYRVGCSKAWIEPGGDADRGGTVGRAGVAFRIGFASATPRRLTAPR